MLVDFDRDRIQSVEKPDGAVPFEGDDPDSGTDRNHRPIAQDDGFTAQVGRILLVSARSGVLNNDTDPDGDELTAKLVGAPIDDLSLMPDGSLTFIPTFDLAPDEMRDVTFEYTAYDGQDESDPATVTIQVTGSDEPSPQAADDDYTVLEDEVLAVDADEGVGKNDMPVAPADTLRFQVLTGPERGSLEFSEDGSFTYTPDADSQSLSGSQTDVVRFTYLLSDDTGRGDTARVTITVVGRNDAPNVPAITAATAPHAALQADPGALLQPLSDADGDPLKITAVDDQPTERGGLVSIAADGSYLYTPPLGLGDVTDQFTFEVSDGTDTVTGTVDVELLGPIVWFVDNRHSGASDGRSLTPFSTLADAQAQAQVGHTIYVRASETPYGAIELKANQRLLGSGLPLTIERRGDDPITVLSAETPATLNGTITLGDDCEVGGTLSAQTGGIGIIGVSKTSGYLHDVQLEGTLSHAIYLAGVGGVFRVERVAIRSPQGVGLYLTGSGADMDVRDLTIEDVLTTDPDPQSGLGAAADAAGVRLEQSDGDFTWLGGAVTFNGDNRIPALRAFEVGTVRIEGRSEDNPLLIKGVGSGVSSGTAPAAIYVENADKVDLKWLGVHDQVHSASNSLGGAHLQNVSQSVSIEGCRFGNIDGEQPLRGPGIVVQHTAATAPFSLALTSNRFASPPSDGLSTAAQIDFNGTADATLNADVSGTEVSAASTALSLSLSGSVGQTTRNSIQIDNLVAGAIGVSGLSIQHIEGANSRIAISESVLNGAGAGAVGLSIYHAGAALDLSIEGNEIGDFVNQGIAIETATALGRFLIADNQLVDDGTSIATDGSAIVLRSNQGRELHATVEDNRVRWSQHSLLARSDDGGRICLDARGNRGEGMDTTPSGDFFLGDVATPDVLTVAIPQDSVSQLNADNNEVGVIEHATIEFDVSCEPVQN